MPGENIIQEGLTWAQQFTKALETFMGRTASIPLGNGGTLSLTDGTGTAVHFGIGNAMVAIEEYEAGKFDGETTTITVGTTTVTYTPPEPKAAVEEDVAKAPAPVETASVEAAAATTEAAPVEAAAAAETVASV